MIQFSALRFSARCFLKAFVFLALIAVLAGVVTSDPVRAQDRRQNAPGEFDFYVLSLSWSPSFCEAASERGNTGRNQQIQCGGRPYSFVVHGLWPQYDRGFPNYCERPAPRLDRNIVSSMLDLMPAPGLIFNEWDKHGTCSGLGARAYFEMVRKARAASPVSFTTLPYWAQWSTASALMSVWPTIAYEMMPPVSLPLNGGT